MDNIGKTIRLVSSRRTREMVVFTGSGVYIHPIGEQPFRWTDSVSALLSIMVAHEELDTDKTLLLVREYDANSEQMVHGNLCFICKEWHHRDYDCVTHDGKPCIACVNSNPDVEFGTELEDAKETGWGLCIEHLYRNLNDEIAKLNCRKDGN